MFGLPLSDMGFVVPAHRMALSASGNDDEEVKRRTFVTRSSLTATALLSDRQGTRVGATDVRDVRFRLADLYSVDHSSGGTSAKDRALRIGNAVTRMLNQGVYTGRVGRELQTVLCEVTCHRAWFGYDGGPSDEARNTCMEALTTAQLVGDPLLQVRALNTLSLLSVDTARIWEASSAIEHASSLAQQVAAGPTVRLVISLREAKVATGAADFTRASRALNRAISYQAHVDSDSDAPNWARFAGPVEVDYAMAAYHTKAGKLTRAVPFLRSAVAGLGGGYRRNTAWYRARLAQALLITGEVEEACHEIDKVLPATTHVSSNRLWQRLRSFEQAARIVGNSTAHESADRIREARRSAP
ncbi:hypothetical protein ACSMX9_10795 [Streptomyces sp. LE64]|uniref:hypothetical protein n=1 Tax=Streptomyces sp. LE64 TaxID=3448653 RepID=UPI0040429105